VSKKFFACAFLTFFPPYTPHTPNLFRVEDFLLRQLRGEKTSKNNNKVFHRIIKAQCGSYAGKKKRIFPQLFCAG
jgi:hypothetical protein